MLNAIYSGRRRSRACGILLLLAFVVSGCRTPQAERRFEYSRPQMGVPFRIVLYAADKETADEGAEQAFRRISELNDILSDYETDSELSRLSRTAGQGSAVPVGPDLWKVLSRAQEISRQSHGAFDVTVGPCVSLWRKARREKKFPDTNRLASARQAVGWEKLVLDSRNHTAKLLLPDMRLDLGGIAKGYAVDEAMKVLRQHDIRHALVSGGGDLAVSDAPPGQRGWRIEVPPLDATNAAEFVMLKNRALATSGDIFQYVELNGVRYSHILDPRTGIGLTDHSLVTVIASDCTMADGLATAVSVLGPEKGLELIEKTDSTAARILRKPGSKVESYKSRRWPK